MVSQVQTVAFQGLEPLPITAQVQISDGLPAFMVVGLPDKAVAESRERVRAALTSLNLALPASRIIVNLSPADVLKEGSHFDLPIALALLAAMGALPSDSLDGVIALGELGLDGTLRPVTGVLAAAMAAEAQDMTLICPAANGGEAVWAGEDLSVVAASALVGLINHLTGRQLLRRPEARLADPDPVGGPDLADVRGQETAKRALEIAAAGGHNLLMIGPPGAGKSMLAARLPGLLPPLSPREALDVTMIHSLAGTLPDGTLISRRPFRDPHHSASLAALVGGGLRARPGEISLAHGGGLCLDERPEFQRPALEALRQPMETGSAVIARANAHLRYPARFQLVAAMNPCRCGHLDDAELACRQAPRCAETYQARLSGPILDRMDLTVTLPGVSVAELAAAEPGEPSSAVRARVSRARAVQSARAEAVQAPLNAHLGTDQLDAMIAEDPAARSFVLEAADRLRLSARAYHRVLRVARTIADLDGRATITRPDVAEALSHRRGRGV